MAKLRKKVSEQNKRNGTVRKRKLESILEKLSIELKALRSQRSKTSWEIRKKKDEIVTASK
jgi:hypothetical protein